MTVRFKVRPSGLSYDSYFFFYQATTVQSIDNFSLLLVIGPVMLFSVNMLCECLQNNVSLFALIGLDRVGRTEPNRDIDNANNGHVKKRTKARARSRSHPVLRSPNLLNRYATARWPTYESHDRRIGLRVIGISVSFPIEIHRCRVAVFAELSIFEGRNVTSAPTTFWWQAIIVTRKL